MHSAIFAINNKVKAWEQIFVIPYYTQFFSRNEVKTISLAANCSYDNWNYQTEQLAEELIGLFEADTLAEYTGFLLDKDPQLHSDLPG